MSNYVYSVDVDTYKKDYAQASELVKLSSIEDVATFFDTFSKSRILGYSIVKVLDIGGKYIFVYDNKNSSFDLYDYVNRICSLDVNISILNSKLMFPESKSRGYYKVSTIPDDLSDTGEIEKESDESATGFLDDDDMPGLVQRKEPQRFLHHLSANIRLPVDDYGIVIGRSSSQSEYVIAKKIISKRHAKVYRQDGKYWVHDFKSTNGTYIDGLKVSETCDRELSVGSTLVLANEEFKFE